MSDSRAPLIVRQTKFADEPLGMEIDFGLTTVDPWEPNTAIEAAELRRPNAACESADGEDHSTGFVYQAPAAGQTGPNEPAWAAQGSIADGSVAWTPVIPGDATGDALASVRSSQISGPDNSLVVAANLVGRKVNVSLTGGSAGLYTFDVTALRNSGNGRTVRLLVTVC